MHWTLVANLSITKQMLGKWWSPQSSIGNMWPSHPACCWTCWRAASTRASLWGCTCFCSWGCACFCTWVCACLCSRCARRLRDSTHQVFKIEGLRATGHRHRQTKTISPSWFNNKKHLTWKEGANKENNKVWKEQTCCLRLRQGLILQPGPSPQQAAYP